jgi:hypothetical protein
MKKLFNKYTVTKIDGSTDPKAEYFVLRIDKDVHARVALGAYADSIEAQEPEFAEELREWILRCISAARHPEYLFNGVSSGNP